MPANVYRFTVKRGHEYCFGRINQIEWPDLFSNCSGYKGTKVFETGERTYVVMDFWSSREAFEFAHNVFSVFWQEEYEKLSKRRLSHCESHEHLGFLNIDKASHLRN